MTREEVVEILKELWRYEKTTKYNDAQIREALETAVEAVEKESRAVKCKDCIYRDKNYCRHYNIYIWLDGFCDKGEER